jgi:hypothetical protein
LGSAHVLKTSKKCAYKKATFVGQQIGEDNLYLGGQLRFFASLKVFSREIILRTIFLRDKGLV